LISFKEKNEKEKSLYTQDVAINDASKQKGNVSFQKLKSQLTQRARMHFID